MKTPLTPEQIAEQQQRQKKYAGGSDSICYEKAAEHPYIHAGPDAGKPYHPELEGIEKGTNETLYNNHPVNHVPCAYHRRKFVESAYKGHQEHRRRQTGNVEMSEGANES